MPQQVQLNLEQMDDPVIGDGTPSFIGGQVSNDQANLIAETESASLLNCDRTRIGKATTRKGSIKLGGTIGSGIIQGQAFYWTKDYQYPVAACDGKIYKYESGAWTQIATGGAFDNDEIEIVKAGKINKTTAPSTPYPIGTTTFTVDTFVGQVAVGDKLLLWQRDKYFEYDITAFGVTGVNVTSITIGDPGSVVVVYDNDMVVVKRINGKINNPSNYPAGATTIAVDGLSGQVASAAETGSQGDWLRIIGEEILHAITGHSETGGNTTSIEFAGTPIQGAYVSSDPTAAIMFAKGVDKLFWTDGIGDIYSWDGKHTGNLKNGNIWDQGQYPAPKAAKIVVWFQNRLIASGIASEPDAIYYSDIRDPSRWDKNFNSHRIGGGESDPISMLVPWMDQNLAVFKQNSVYVVNMDPRQNPTPEDPTALVSSFAVKLITKYVGCAAPRTAVQVGGEGGDIFFMASDRQVRSLRRTIAAESQQELGQALSLPIKDLLDRMNTAYMHHSVAVYWNDRYLLSVPLDSAQYPTATFPFYTAAGNWSGIWSGWHPTSFSGREVSEGVQVLLFGQSDGTVFQWLEDTGADELLEATYQDNGVDIPTTIVTRGYTFGDLYVLKTGLNVEFEFTDSLAFITVVAILDQSTQPGVIGSFATTSLKPLILPFILPATLPIAVFLREQKDLHRLGQFREIQLNISSEKGKLSMRSIKLMGFHDTVQLQTLRNTPVFAE